MTRSTFKTLFYINRSKEKKNGKCPIMGRITIDGEQVQYSTGKEIAPELWDSRKGRCKGIGEETKEINRYLQSKEEQAKAKYQELVWQRGYITAELLKRELMEEDKPKGFLMEEARLFIEEKRPCVGITVAKPTFANYIYATQLIEAYLRERLGQEDIRYAQLDYVFIEGLDFYLKSERNLSLATIQVAVIFLRKLIGIGQQKKYIRIDPFADYKAELPTTQGVISLQRSCNEYYKRPSLTGNLSEQGNYSFSVPSPVWLVWTCNGSNRSISSIMQTAQRKSASKGRKQTWKPSFHSCPLPSKSFRFISRTRKRTT